MHVHIYIMYVMYVHIYIIYYLDSNRVLGGREAKSTDRPRRNGARGARERGGEGAGPHEVPYPGFSGRVWVWVACLKNLGGLLDGRGCLWGQEEEEGEEEEERVGLWLF